MTLVPFLMRALRAVLLVFGAIVILVEEFGWRPLAGVVTWLSRWPPLARLEALIRRARPGLALALFLVPAVLLVPVKLGALWLIEEGHVMHGVGLIIAAKIVGTALVGRLFMLLEPQLMQFAWFARAVDRWRVTRDRVMTALRQSRPWRLVRALRRVVRQWRRRAAH